MFKSLREGTLEWVRDNCPQAAMLGPERTLELVKRVLDETGAIRILLNIGGSIFGGIAGMLLAEHWLISGDSHSLYVGSATLGMVVVGLLANVAGQHYLHRKLESAFESA